MQVCFICSLELALGHLGSQIVPFLLRALLVGAAEPPPSHLGSQMVSRGFLDSLGHPGLPGSSLGHIGLSGATLGHSGLSGATLGYPGPVGTILGHSGLAGTILGHSGVSGATLGHSGIAGTILGHAELPGDLGPLWVSWGQSRPG